MNILADFHHADLWWSLQLLADRLSATLHRPYGMDWYNEGYYKLYGDLSKKEPERYIAKKYLVNTIYDYNIIGTTVNIETGKVLKGGNGIGEETLHGDKNYPRFNLLTLEQAKNMDIDIVICSVNENEEPFMRLKEFYPNAKFIRQVGNDLDVNTIYPNLLASAITPYESFKGNKVLYRQEFDLNLFKPVAIKKNKNIYSFQNNLEKFEDTFQVWNSLKHSLRNFTFKSYGRENDDGNIYSKKRYIRKMEESSFIFQSKGVWEGYGHTIHNAICVGRPMIIKYSDYKGKLAEPLLIKDQTYLEMTDPDLADKIKYYSEPSRLREISKKCQQVFKENVNFDEEYQEVVKTFFDNLI